MTRTRRAFTVTEMMVVLVLLAFALGMATKLFVEIVRLTEHCEQIEVTQRQFERLRRRLAEDCWHATAIVSTSPDSLRLTLPAGEVVEYHTSPADADNATPATVVRQVHGQPTSMTYRLFPDPVRFSASRTVAVLTMPSRVSVAEDRLVFPSQFGLARGGQP